MGNSALPAHAGNDRHSNRSHTRGLDAAISIGTLVLVLFTAGVFAAQPSVPRGSDFEIVSSVIAGGGVSTAAEGCFVLDATLGQPVVGRASGGDFVLDAGFWMQSPRDEHIFSNGFESGVCPP